MPIAIANSSLARNRWFAFELPQIAIRYDPDVVHLGFPMPIFRSRFACPVVVTVHDLYPFDWPEAFRRFNGFCKRIFFRQCMKESDAVACVSESTRAALERHFPELSSRVPVRLVHNYVDFSLSGDAFPHEVNQRPFLLAVAQHQPNKRLDLLLLAFAQLRREKLVSQELLLLVVGSTGAQSDALLKLAKSLQLDACVQWLPSLPDSRLASLYKSCEVFIASSCIEGFCLPLLEAMSFNCRIVASDIPVFHEIAGDSPVYFDISHAAVESLLSAIVTALDSSPNAMRHAVKFCREKTAAECLALYSLLLHDKLAGRDRTASADPSQVAMD